MMWKARLMPIPVAEASHRRRPFPCWLSAGEVRRLQEITSAQRKRQWLGGRWLAKQIVKDMAPIKGDLLADLHIESRDGGGRPVPPRVYWQGRLQPWCLTISHSSDWVYVAASTNPTFRLGADVVEASPLPPAVAPFWFSPGERAWCHWVGFRLAETLVWSLKESWYKAVGSRLPFAPRKINVVRSTPLSELPRSAFSQGENWAFAVARGACWITCSTSPRALATLVGLRDRCEERIEPPAATEEITLPRGKKS